MSNSPLLQLPLIQQSQSQKYLTHNTAICALEALVSGCLNILNTPPVSPSEGDRYIITTTATGAWLGKEKYLAEFLNGIWVFYPPFLGAIIFNIADTSFYYYNGTDWLQWVATGSGINNLIEDLTPQLGGNLDVNNFSIVDTNANELIKFGVTASAVNEITLTNNSTTNNPKLSSTGNDTNIGLTIEGKGTGIITFNSPVYFAKPQDMVVTDMTTGVSINLSLGNIFKRDAIAGDVTFTISNTTTNYHIFSFLFTYTSGTITWFSGITWDGGTAPTLTASKIYEFTFKTYDGGTNWYGAISFTNA